MSPECKNQEKSSNCNYLLEVQPIESKEGNDMKFLDDIYRFKSIYNSKSPSRFPSYIIEDNDAATPRRFETDLECHEDDLLEGFGKFASARSNIKIEEESDEEEIVEFEKDLEDEEQNSNSYTVLEKRNVVYEIPDYFYDYYLKCDEDTNYFKLA